MSTGKEKKSQLIFFGQDIECWIYFTLFQYWGLICDLKLTEVSLFKWNFLFVLTSFVKKRVPENNWILPIWLKCSK